MALSKAREELFQRASKLTPGGVHSAIRAIPYRPLVFKDARGSRIVDVQGDEYIDFHMAFGAKVLGHCHPAVVRAVQEQAERGDLWGAGTSELEIKVAEKIVEHVPSAEMVRFANSGSEATYHAIRAARSFTRRKKILKFEGCYHGWHDYVALNVLPPPEYEGRFYPESGGMLGEAASQTIIVPFNDEEAVEAAVREHRSDLAAIIVEPIQHNIGCILPKDGYLHALKELTERNDILLIFDEVITGFRHGLGGAQTIFAVKPDITTLGKALANGYPAAAVVGREDVMKTFEPTGDVLMGGTFNAHPVSMAAALATIGELEQGYFYEEAESLAESIRKELTEIITDARIRARVAGFKSIFVIYFVDAAPASYAAIRNYDSQMLAKYNQMMLDKGIFLIPRPLKRAHISGAHATGDAERFLEAAANVIPALKKN